MARGMTMAEHILARASTSAAVTPGDIAVCTVDKVNMNDTSFLASQALPTPKRVFDPGRVAIIYDHAVPAPSALDAEAQARGRQFAQRLGIERLYADRGIGHQVILEEGLAVPGQLLAHSDSHTCSAGVANCAGRGVGLLDILQILCTGRTWYRVAPTIRYELVGERPQGVYGKDVLLYLAGAFGDHVAHNVEYGGSGLSSLSFDDRATMSAMAAEISAEFSLFPYDEVAQNYLAPRISEEFEPAEADVGADYAAVRTVDLGTIEPYVSMPDFVPDNTRPVSGIGDVPIQQAFIGSCANGKLSDLATAAAVVEGRRVHDGVRFIVTPASSAIYAEAARLGYLETLTTAGAIVTNSTCGACCGYHLGVLGAGDTCVTSSTRNFKGRMGSPDARIYLASSATVAASAVAGRIVGADRV